MSSGLNYRTLCLVAPSGECLRGRAVDCSCLAPCVAASCLAKPSCYTCPVCRYWCCPEWQLVYCVDCASAFDICEIKNYFTLLFLEPPKPQPIYRHEWTMLIAAGKSAEVLQQWNFIGGYFWSVGPVPFDTSCFYPPVNRAMYPDDKSEGKSPDLSACGATV